MKKILFVLVLSCVLVGLSSAAFANPACCPAKGNTADCSQCSDCSDIKHINCGPNCSVTHRESKRLPGVISNDYTKGLPQVAGEIEKTGTLEVTFYGRYHKIEKVYLHSGDESIRLIHSAKHSMRYVERMNGKMVAVRGKIRPKSKKHPEEAFEVIHISEIQ